MELIKTVAIINLPIIFIKEIKNKIIFESLSRIKITEDLHRCSFNIASVILKMVICCIIELQFFESPLFLYFNLW